MFSKERPLCPSFYSILCLNKAHETLSLNWSKYKAFGNTRHPPHPNSRTISINVNKSYVEGEAKPSPLCFIASLFYELVSWMINQRYCKTVILWGKPSLKFPFLVLCGCCQKEKSERPNTSGGFLTCSDCGTVDDTPLKCQLPPS